MASLKIPDLPDSPNQPTNYDFLKKLFGKKTVVARSFQATWFCTWKWLHYDELNDKAYCFYCVKGFKEKKLKAPNAEPAFVSLYLSFSAKV